MVCLRGRHGADGGQCNSRLFASDVARPTSEMRISMRLLTRQERRKEGIDGIGNFMCGLSTRMRHDDIASDRDDRAILPQHVVRAHTQLGILATRKRRGFLRVSYLQEEERRRGDGRTDDTLSIELCLTTRGESSAGPACQPDYRAVLAAQAGLAAAGLGLHQDGVGRAA